MLAAGEKAPQFTLNDLEGNAHSLDGILARGPVLLTLFKVNCPTCQLTLPFLERISQGTLPVVTISQDDAAATRRFQQSFGLTMPALIDPASQGYKVSNAVGISTVPSLFVVEPDGEISSAGAGFNKAEIEQIGKRGGVEVFRQDDNVPAWKAG